VYVKCTNVINVICGLGRALIILISSSIEIYGSHLCVVSVCITEDEDGELTIANATLVVVGFSVDVELKGILTETEGPRHLLD